MRLVIGVGMMLCIKRQTVKFLLLVKRGTGLWEGKANSKDDNNNPNQLADVKIKST